MGVFAGLLLLIVACTEPRATEPEAVGSAMARAPSGPAVSAASPNNSPRDTTLDVQVTGSGFDQGSRVDLALAGVLDPVNVHTNSTRFVSSTALVVNVTISSAATFASYDVVVQPPSGKKGIGSEIFTVRPYNDIGTLGAGGSQSATVPEAANAAGLIVGRATDSAGRIRGFVWSQANGIRALPQSPGQTTSEASGLNDSGTIVGYSGRLAVRWVSTGPDTWMVQSLNLPGAGTQYPFAVNDAGTIVGWLAETPDSPEHKPFSWTEAGGTFMLPLPAGRTCGHARGINRSGTVVGHDCGASTNHALVWPTTGGVAQLADCPNGMSIAYAINAANVVVGKCWNASSTFAVRWLPDPSRPNAWLAPEVLSGTSGCTSSTAWGINDAGEIAGERCRQPFYWDAVRGLRLLPVYTPNGSGKDYAVNDASPGALSLITGPMNTPKGTRGVWWSQP